MTKETITATIDSREPSEVVGEVASHPDVAEWEWTELPAGDLVFGDVLVERKTPNDFAASVTNDQRNIYDQARKMTESWDGEKRILIEGTFQDFDSLSYTRIPSKALRGAAASVEIRFGIPVVPCGDLATLVDYGVRLGRKTVEDPGSTFIKSGAVSSTDAPITVRLLSCLDGFGPETATRAADYFGSVAWASMADETEWQKIDGIGPELAANAVEALQHG